MMKPRCAECGDTKPLNDEGVCRNRHGCEHRQFQHKARMQRLQDEMDHAEHCPIHGMNPIILIGDNSWGTNWGQPVPSMYEQFINGLVLGTPMFGMGWYTDMMDNDEDEQ